MKKEMKSIESNTRIMQDSIRSNADRISNIEEDTFTILDNYDRLLNKVETLELKVKEMADIIRQLQEWI